MQAIEPCKADHDARASWSARPLNTNAKACLGTQTPRPSGSLTTSCTNQHFEYSHIWIHALIHMWFRVWIHKFVSYMNSYINSHMQIWIYIWIHAYEFISKPFLVPPKSYVFFMNSCVNSYFPWIHIWIQGMNLYANPSWYPGIHSFSWIHARYRGYKMHFVMNSIFLPTCQFFEHFAQLGSILPRL